MRKKTHQVALVRSVTCCRLYTPQQKMSWVGCGEILASGGPLKHSALPGFPGIEFSAMVLKHGLDPRHLGSRYLTVSHDVMPIIPFPT